MLDMTLWWCINVSNSIYMNIPVPLPGSINYKHSSANNMIPTAYVPPGMTRQSNGKNLVATGQLTHVSSQIST